MTYFTFYDFLYVAGTVLVLLPVSAYMCARMGRYGWLAAEMTFRREHPPTDPDSHKDRRD